ncbi:hypothetical protein [Saccharopolyspora sp. NPDC002376]
MAASTVREIHAVISGTLDAAERWDWISFNPACVARKPRQKRPAPDPPTPAEAACLSEEAFRMDDDWAPLSGSPWPPACAEANSSNYAETGSTAKEKTPKPNKTDASQSTPKLSPSSANTATESPTESATS